eukprot:CCRYP_007010-RA/>CCRYP_007010-RA protein AED:0.02 eAED:0.02 QI:2847/1/1/1/1/1/3/3003/332
MSAVDWMDPRLTVFVIWGVCVIVFLCYPNKYLVAKICHRLGLPCCAHFEEVSESNASSSDDDAVDYEYLSSAKKHEIDSLRSIALLRHLSQFSMTIKKDDVLRRESMSTLHLNESQSTTNNSLSKNDPQCKEEQDRNPQDIEEGLQDPSCNEEDDTSQNNAEEQLVNEECDEVDYTHVMIPCPGRADCSPALRVAPRKNEKQLSRKRLFVLQKDKKGRQETKHNNISDHSAEPIREQEKQKRVAPIFCAVCLMEYKISERVCWSSNPECTHVFHEDCIVNWLLSLGRTKAKMQRFSESPTEAQLLNYALECPCCRQEFVSKSALAEDADDHV